LRQDRTPPHLLRRGARAARAPAGVATLLAALVAGAAAAPARAQGIAGCPGPTLGSWEPPPATRPWTDPSLAPEVRAELLLAEMTLEEKVDLATGELCLIYGYYGAPIARLGIPALTMADGPAGVRITYGRVNGGRATQLPAPIALAASWDPALAAAQGDLLAAEAFATGHNVLLGPTLDLARTPLAGRNFEGFGEDPLLASRLAVPFVRAIQAHPVLADAKHFAGYNQENARFTLDARIGPRALRELHLRPFEAAVRDAEVGTVMCGFNRVNGTFACEDPWLLSTVLKGELGFRGFVLSDWGAIHDTVAAALAGLDQEQAVPRYYGWALVDAVRRGDVPGAVVDDKARRILWAMFRFGLFEHPVAIAPLPEAEHGTRSREIAEQGVVLLANAGLLPLDAGAIRSIAVIGADAANASAQGGGAARVTPTYEVSALDGLAARAGAGVRVTWAPGTDPVTPAHLLPGPAPIPSSVLSPPGAPGAPGLRAEYWLNPGFDGPPDLVRVDRQIAASAGFFAFPSINASSVAALPASYALTKFSARWTGTLTAPATGEYALTLASRGRAWVWLDGTLVVDHSEPHALAATRSVAVRLEAGVPRALRVDYAADDPAIGRDVDVGGDVKLGWEMPAEAVPPAMREAARVASEADVAVVVLRDYESEGRDRPDLALPGDQDRLVREVAAANPRTVVVLMTGQPVAMPWLDAVAAVVQAWYPGQEQGNVVARVLFGDVNPSGKLPVTFPRSVHGIPPGAAPAGGGATPAVPYAEGMLLGYRGYDALGVAPLFPFGHGRSYTTFRYEGLAVEPPARRRGAGARSRSPAERLGPARVAFTLTNTGSRAGAEVAQVYVGSCARGAPPKQLAGFAKVSLAPGESRRVVVELAPESLFSWSDGPAAWLAPACRVPVWVGSSSRDVRLGGAVRVPAGA
jgi:beta-glucosidase